MTILRDSAYFSPSGRRLLVHLGAIVPDPLRVEAETWLLAHRGAQTFATRKVRAVLGPPPPIQWRTLAARMRGVK